MDDASREDDSCRAGENLMSTGGNVIGAGGNQMCAGGLR